MFVGSATAYRSINKLPAGWPLMNMRDEMQRYRTQSLAIANERCQFLYSVFAKPSID
jgi:hypothetical protein